MAFTILPSATAVHGKLRELFSVRTRGRRRVVLVAYVGRDARDLLPDFQNVEIYCWPQTGATDPYALAELRRLPYQARIRLVDQMHMKVYWVESKGFVITSANLSRRALGSGIREEIGVFVGDSTLLDIDQILGRLSSRALTIDELKAMQLRHDAYWAATPAAMSNAKARPIPSYLEWYNGDRSPQWKFSWWDEYGDESPSTSEFARRTHGVKSINDFFPCLSGQLKERDWVLSFKLGVKGKASSATWGRVDCVNPVSREEAQESGYPFEAVQLRPLSPEHQRPFLIERHTFQKAVDDFGAKRIRDARDLRPSSKFLAALAAASASHRAPSNKR